MGKHLTSIDRKSIEVALTKRSASLGEIGRQLGKSTSTISREVRKHSISSDIGAMGRPLNRCIHRRDCSCYGLCMDKPNCTRKCSTCKTCNLICPSFVEEVCPKLSEPPYVCNGCPERKGCQLRKVLYKADDAEKQYTITLHESREGFNLSEDELLAMDAFYSPLLSHGQSVYHINTRNRNQALCSDSTLYRLIRANAITARPIDMPRMCRLKPRKGIKPSMKIDKSCTIGRKYEDLMAFLEVNPGVMVSEIDSVEGRKGGKVLLTIILTNCSFMLAFIRDRNDAQSVIDCFNWLYDTLPGDIYSNMFSVLKGDNGTEFSNPKMLEFDQTAGKQRSHVFYCHPSAPFEKPHVENNHTLLRRILPKGTSFDHLEQKDIDFIMSNINSYGRNIYNGISPTELFINIYGEEVLHLLRQELIDAKDIILKPDLVR